MQRVPGTPPAERLSYAEAYRRYAGVEPHLMSAEDLRRAADRLGASAGFESGGSES